MKINLIFIFKLKNLKNFKKFYFYFFLLAFTNEFVIFLFHLFECFIF